MTNNHCLSTAVAQVVELKNTLEKQSSTLVQILEKLERTLPNAKNRTPIIAQTLLVLFQEYEIEWKCEEDQKLKIISALIDPGRQGIVVCTDLVDSLLNVGVISLTQVQKYMDNQKRWKANDMVLRGKQVDTRRSLIENSAFRSALAHRESVVINTSSKISDKYLKEYREINYKPPAEIQNRLIRKDRYRKAAPLKGYSSRERNITVSAKQSLSRDDSQHEKDSAKINTAPQQYGNMNETENLVSNAGTKHDIPHEYSSQYIPQETVSSEVKYNVAQRSQPQEESGYVEREYSGYYQSKSDAHHLRSELRRRDLELRETKRSLAFLRENNKSLREKAYPVRTTPLASDKESNPKYPQRPPPLSPVARLQQSPSTRNAHDLVADVNTAKEDRQSRSFNNWDGAIESKGGATSSVPLKPAEHNQRGAEEPSSLTGVLPQGEDSHGDQEPIGHVIENQMNGEPPHDLTAIARPESPEAAHNEGDDCLGFHTANCWADETTEPTALDEFALDENRSISSMSDLFEAREESTHELSKELSEEDLAQIDAEVSAGLAPEDRRQSAANPAPVRALLATYFVDIVPNPLKRRFLALPTDQERYESLRGVVWWLAACECATLASPALQSAPLRARLAFLRLPRHARTMRLLEDDPATASARFRDFAAAVAETPDLPRRKEIVGSLVAASELGAQQSLSRARGVGSELLTAWSELGERARGAVVLAVLDALRGRAEPSLVAAVEEDLIAVLARQVLASGAAYPWVNQSDPQRAAVESARAMAEVLLLRQESASGSSWSRRDVGGEGPQLEGVEPGEVLRRLEADHCAPLSPREKALRSDTGQRRSVTDEELDALEARVARQVEQVSLLVSTEDAV